MNENKISLIKAITDEKEMGMCKCGKNASVRSYGGESGDYECSFEMLKRINGIK